MSQAYGDADRDESIATVHRALDLGVTFLDTSDVYGEGHNEELVGEAIAGRRDEVQLATKFSLSHDDHGRSHIDGRPENVRACAEASLRRLGVDVIDLYYQHRVDPRVPIEDTVGAMAELVAAGQGPPPRAVGGERRLDPPGRRRPPDRGAAERVVAVDPGPGGGGAGRGPRARHRDRAVQPARPRLPHRRDHQPGGLRRGRLPARRTPASREAFAANLRLVDAVRALAADKGRRPASWPWPGCSPADRTSSRSPGTKRRRYLEENVGAVAVELTDDDLARLDEIAPAGAAAGGRYSDAAYATARAPSVAHEHRPAAGRRLRLAGGRRAAALGRRAGLPHGAGRARPGGCRRRRGGRDGGRASTSSTPSWRAGTPTSSSPTTTATSWGSCSATRWPARPAGSG